MWFEEAVKEARKVNKNRKITVETDSFIFSITNKELSLELKEKMKGLKKIMHVTQNKDIFRELELAKIYSNKWEIINE